MPENKPRMWMAVIIVVVVIGLLVGLYYYNQSLKEGFIGCPTCGSGVIRDDAIPA